MINMRASFSLALGTSFSRQGTRIFCFLCPQKAISVLEMENGYWWCRRKRHRSGRLLKVGTRWDGVPDERWCFR